MNLAQAFQKQAAQHAQIAMLTYGCPTKRLLEAIETKGGVETAKSFIGRNRLSDGFAALQNAGHLELSLEALVIQGKYGALFTDDEVNFCLEVLMEAGYF